jgi:CheY-like chemotaxis protein
MTQFDRRSGSAVPADLLARLSLALRAALGGERSEASLLPLTREFGREGRRRGIPPEGVVLAFKDALGATPPRAYEGRYHRIREHLIAQCIAAYYAPAGDTPPGVALVPDAERYHAAVVDDDPVIVALLAHILAPAFVVVRFDDARHALAAFLERRPDLVVFDLHLPDYSGQMLLGVLRSDQRLRGVPAIAVTGDDDLTERQMRELGFDAFFRKPLLDADEILRTAVALAEHSGAIRSVAPHPR